MKSIVEAILLGVSLFGLWQSKRWGWLLAVLADVVICVLYLHSVIEYQRLFLNSRILAFNAWEFGAVAVLLHLPVRAYFQGKRDLPGLATSQWGMPLTDISALQRSFRRLLYFVLAIAATCIVTTFSLAMMMGDKVGGIGGFLILLVFGVEIGGVASFLFSLILTIAVGKFGPARLATWLIAGGLLAPGLVLGLGLLAKSLEGINPRAAGPLSMFLNILCTGPLYLFQVWWLAIPAGIVTSFLCCQLYSWAFERLK